jgi:hypothetical protein
MGKRSNFKRKENDFYPTPYPAVIPLIRHLPTKVRYIEPCFGAGDLIRHLHLHGHECTGSYDLPDDVTVKQYDTTQSDLFITNPPWSRDLLHPTIHNLRKQLPTWLLFDAGWAFTKQARQYLPFCKYIVTVGRVKWIPGSKYGSLDDACWYLFVKNETETKFFGAI